ncbi:IS21 family transposase [Enterococcus saccharolyticus]|uniref:Integrase catalytic domain-containing protein n=1 Tax=Enterococcus saccharolyticus subsp. saccharolyticus ATCC 43076 TaxID=1139996 RepID=S0J0D2_9ENTE|nr:IS21 family transposase [Enterococcus saccharolyticus]EOT26264.1 hypothetical protein OMQ_02313 [Enterococcus saccharolyticus subsp. saccharolyticus ATCC 43076]EOT82789.1 hypothetical protein I572_00329 [Enterococcus saccharolyticus subsp. saccharolyticus ATCC 43076]OJG91150.1 hypothetical protein RV16_GL000136 [Enterococcus saccharolyticus]
MRKDIQEGVKFYIMNNIKPNYAELARQYDCDPRTVRNHFREGTGEKTKIIKRSSSKKISKLDPFKPLIEEKVADGCSATAIYSLIKRLGYEGKITILRDYCRTIKVEKVKKATIRIETSPGLSAQVDWKENMTLYTREGRAITFNIFLYVLGYSRYKYLDLTFDRKQDTLFNCLIEAFKLSGGVPTEIWFDNMKTVVDRSKTQFTKVKFNDTFYEFAKDAGFNPIACRPFRPQTKGKVEALARTVERLRVWNYLFYDETELIELVHMLMDELNYEHSQATGEAPAYLLEAEKEHLHDFDDQLLYKYTEDDITRIVTAESLVQFRNSKYSVPTKYIGEEVDIELSSDDQIHIHYNGERINSHYLSDKKFNYQRTDLVEILKSDLMKHDDEADILSYIENSLSQYDEV